MHKEKNTLKLNHIYMVQTIPNPKVSSFVLILFCVSETKSSFWITLPKASTLFDIEAGICPCFCKSACLLHLKSSSYYKATFHCLF